MTARQNKTNKTKYSWFSLIQVLNLLYLIFQDQFQLIMCLLNTYPSPSSIKISNVVLCPVNGKQADGREMGCFYLK